MSRERTPSEIERGLNEVEDEEVALKAANAEKPARDLAREKESDVTREEKALLDKLAERKGELAVKKERELLSDPAQVSQRNRIELIQEAQRKKIQRESYRGVHYRLNTDRTELQPSEGEWQALLEFTRGERIYPIIADLHASGNAPVPTKKYQDSGIVKYEREITASCNNVFRSRELPYRLVFTERPSSFSEGFVKLSIVRYR